MTILRLCDIMKPFISAKEAFELSEKSKNVLFIDTRYDFNQEAEFSLNNYNQNHIPGAIFINIHEELSGPETPETGRHPLPSMKDFKELLDTHFITKDLRIICYDDNKAGYSGRLWFMLYTVGFDSVQMLNGGLSAWMKQGYPTTSEPTVRTGEKASLDLPADWSEGKIRLVDFGQVTELVSKGFTGLVDARTSNRFHGEKSSLDTVGGHIPGASNRWWEANITEEGTLRDLKELKKEFELLFINNKPEEAIMYCGSGVTACYNLAVMKELGFQEPGLYIGSFSDWSAHSDNIET